MPVPFHFAYHVTDLDEARAKREEFERVRLETLADQRRLDKEISDMKKAEAREKIGRASCRERV